MSTTDRVVAALERELEVRFGAPRRVTRIERRPSAYRSSFVLEEVDVTLDDGSSLSLMLKHLGPQSATAAGRPVKPMFLHDPAREVHTYRHILATRPLGTAVCYGVLGVQEFGEDGLLLERVEGMPLCFVGEFEAWTASARWLAALHGPYLGRISHLPRSVPLLRYDRAFYRRWMNRAVEYHKDIAWLAARYERVIDRLESLPPTFIHGEFYASNILTQETERGLRICPVDWETAAVGPGLIDLAALVTGHWTDEERRALAVAYHEGLDASGGERAELEDLLENLDYCRLHLAVQWLGWAPDWSPPPEHRQDWRASATELAARLGL